MSKQQLSNEQNLQLSIQKLAAKYQAIITMINELEDNLNAVIQASFAIIKEKDDKIRELQVPVKETKPAK